MDVDSKYVFIFDIKTILLLISGVKYLINPLVIQYINTSLNSENPQIST